MNIISKILLIANNLDNENHKISDKLEKIAASNMINTFVDPSTLTQGWESAGGGDINGSLGGYHTQVETSGDTSNLNSSSINEASQFVNELANDLPVFEQWQQQHPNITSNPQEVFNILRIWQPYYRMGIQDIGKLQSVLGMSGPVNLQFATNAPSSEFQSWGITPDEILEHEIGHANNASSSPEEYMQMAVPGADFMQSQGIGGGIKNPNVAYYEMLMNNLMMGQGAEEFGANKKVWDRVIRDKAPNWA